MCKGMETGVVRGFGWKRGRRRDQRSSIGTNDKDLNQNSGAEGKEEEKNMRHF